MEFVTSHFAYPELLWLLFCAPLLLLNGLRKNQSLLAAVFRALAVSCLVIALAAPRSEESSEEARFAALVDVSDSVSNTALSAELGLLSPLLENSSNSLLLYPFASELAGAPIRIDASSNISDVIDELNDQGDTLGSGETDLAAAIKQSTKRQIADSVLLLSDGFSTRGNPKQAAKLAARNSVRIFPLLAEESEFLQKEVEISSLYAPLLARTGEKTSIRVTLANPLLRKEEVSLSLRMGDKELYSQTTQLEPEQEQVIEIPTSELEGGLHKIEAVLTSAGESESKKHRWISVKEKSKLLLIHGSKSEQRVLNDLIRLSGYGLEEIVAGKAKIPVDFSAYSSVLLNNVAKKQLPAAFLENLEKFVSSGGGALLIGGNRSFGLGGYIKTPLEKISPVKFLPPQSKKRRLKVAVALIIDKSGSMEHEGKILAARQAAISAINSLRDDDYVTVIGFDSGPFVVIQPMPVAEAKREAARLLRPLTAKGQTNLLPALQEARQRFTRIRAGRKHFIVLSDGRFPVSDSAYSNEINQLRRASITLSTIALGSDVDKPFLRFLAKEGGGFFYETTNAQTLPKLFLKDVKVSTGEETMSEDSLFKVSRGPGRTRSTLINTYPPLKGFVETLPKRNASLELVTRKGRKIFPILANWAYGKGRVAAFTSDANGRWSLPWLRWPGFPKFWGQVIEFIKSRSNESAGEVDFDIRYRINGRELTAELSIFDDRLKKSAPPTISMKATAPNGEQKKVFFEMLAKGRFEAKLEDIQGGDHKFDISYGKLKLPALAYHVDGSLLAERQGLGINRQSLEQIAYLSGGIFNPPLESLSGSVRAKTKTTNYSGYFALLALILAVVEIYARERRWFAKSSRKAA